MDKGSVWIDNRNHSVKSGLVHSCTYTIIKTTDLINNTINVPENVVFSGFKAGYVKRLERLSGCKGGRVSNDLLKITCKECLEWIADYTVKKRAEIESEDYIK